MHAWYGNVSKYQNEPTYFWPRPQTSLTMCPSCMRGLAANSSTRVW